MGFSMVMFYSLPEGIPVVLYQYTMFFLIFPIDSLLGDPSMASFDSQEVPEWPLLNTSQLGFRGDQGETHGNLNVTPSTLW